MKTPFAAAALALAFAAAPVLAQGTAALAPAAYSAQLSAPRTVTGAVPLSLTVQNVSGPESLAAARDNRQDCATAPLVRVLEVGTRRVVYPPAQAEPMLCAQDMDIRTVGVGEATTYERELALPAGEYMIEGWFAGTAGGDRVKIPAQPLRVSVH